MCPWHIGDELAGHGQGGAVAVSAFQFAGIDLDGRFRKDIFIACLRGLTDPVAQG
jgi:hypothetical protein